MVVCGNDLAVVLHQHMLYSVNPIWGGYLVEGNTEKILHYNCAGEDLGFHRAAN